MKTLVDLERFLAARVLTLRASFAGGLFRADLMNGVAMVACGAGATLSAALSEAVGSLERRERAGLRS